MRHCTSSSSPRWWLLAIAACAQAAVAADEPGADDSSKLPAVTVTAQKREQNAQSVAIPMSVVSGEQLDRLGLSSPSQIPQVSAGVNLAQPNGTGSFSFAVRGVTQNDFADHQESPTAIYVDGAYVSQMTGLAFQLFDLDRVEVLRGPQGTLFGRNATGGLAQFISRGPTPHLDGYVKASYGSYNDVRTEGAIGGPLGTDLITGRIAFATENHSPIFANSTGGPGLENGDQKAYRGQLLFKLPNEASLLVLTRQGNQDVRAGGWESVPAVPGPDGYGVLSGGLNANGYGPTGHYRDNGEQVGHARVDTFGQLAKFEMPVAPLGAKLTALVDYQHVSKSYSEDSDTTPLKIFEFFNGNTVNQYSAEARLNGDVDGVKWIAGVYHLHIGGNYNQGESGDAYPGSFLYSPYKLETRSTSGFGQVELPVAERVSVTAGVRYSQDRKTFSYRSSYEGFDYRFDSSTVGDLATLSNGFWSGKLEADWKPVDATLLYASVNRGVKAGGFSAPLDASAFSDPNPLLRFKPETLTDYEAGAKSEWLDKSLRVNASVFYYDYKNYQALELFGLGQLIVNRPAQYKGGELEVQFAPSREWLVGGNIAYSQGVVHDLDLNGMGARDYRPANAPQWQGNASVRYTTGLGNGEASAQVDGNFLSTQFFALTNAQDARQNSYGLLNARLNYATKDGQYDATLSVENLTGKHYATMIFDLAAPPLGISQIYPGRPRWFTASVAYHF